MSKSSSFLNPLVLKFQEWAKFLFSLFFFLYINKLFVFTRCWFSCFNVLMFFFLWLFVLLMFSFSTLLSFLLVLKKEANFWLQWEHQGSLLTKILSKILCFKV